MVRGVCWWYAKTENLCIMDRAARESRKKSGVFLFRRGDRDDRHGDGKRQTRQLGVGSGASRERREAAAVASGGGWVGSRSVCDSLMDFLKE